jgi:hypothetical protein
MELTDEQLQKIIKMGADGYSYSRIASELNTTYTQLERERKSNKKLDDALTEAMRNFKLYYIDAIIESNKGKSLTVLSKALDMQDDILNESNDRREKKSANNRIKTGTNGHKI